MEGAEAEMQKKIDWTQLLSRLWELCVHGELLWVGVGVKVEAHEMLSGQDLANLEE